MKDNDLVFGCLRQVIRPKSSYLPDINVAHQMGVKAMGRVIRIKDLRHLAAISWAKADVRIELIKEWLGHATVNQTMTYSRFIPTHGEIFQKIASAAQPGGIADEP
jgi:integrase